MSSEPNKTMEELLKQYAEQRKAAARSDFELHPATRKLLQGEATRTFGETDDIKKRSLIFMLWPRIAIVCAFTALLAVTLMVLNTPNEQNLEVVQKSSEKSSAPLQSEVQESSKILSDARVDRTASQKREIAARSPAAFSDRGGVAANSERTFSEPTNHLTPSKKRTESFSENAVPMTDSSHETFARVREGDTVLKAKSATVVTNSAAVGAVASTQLFADSESPTRWQFAQQDLRAKYRQNLLSPVQPKILKTFELARDGNKINVFDGDGSVYEGEVLPVAQDNVAGKETSEAMEENSNFAFRAVGLNQQINQIVTFTGQTAFENNQLIPSEKTVARASITLPLDELKKQTNAGVGGFIQGKVFIAGTNAFEIRATEVQK